MHCDHPLLGSEESTKKTLEMLQFSGKNGGKSWIGHRCVVRPIHNVRFFPDCDCDSSYRYKWATATTSLTPMLPIVGRKQIAVAIRKI